MNERLSGSTNIWLTGAGSGIGQALARKLLADGHHLLISGRQRAPLEAIKTLARGRVEVLPVDIATDERLSDQLQQPLKELAPLGMVILNAGTCEYLDASQFDASVVERNMATNVIGTARCIEAALPALRATRRQGLPATLVIVSSSAWWFPFGRAEGYGASKAALSYLARSLRADLASEGIEVVLVSPGFVDTPLTRQNDFPMPFLISADAAAQRLIQGLHSGRSELEFPRRFTWMLRILGALPRGLVDALAARLARPETMKKTEDTQ